MKIMIAYTTKTGCCAECAKLLAEQLKNHSVDIYDISVVNPKIEEYDLCIIGGSIRMGKLDKKIRTFINDNENLLMNKKTAYFICNAFSDQSEYYFKKAFPRWAIDGALFFDSFGGELKLDKQKGLDKLIVKLILKENEENDEFTMPNILTESIGRFADKIKSIKEKER